MIVLPTRYPIQRGCEKEKGCRFALDDFGCARSSFGRLGSLPVDYLKIKGAIARRLLDSPVDSVLTETIGRIGRLVGTRTIATQVENAGTLEKAKELGLDYAQGFEVARPAPLMVDTVRTCGESPKGA